MSRLIKIQPGLAALPPALTVQVRDVLVFAATGGHVRSGQNVVELLGAFVTGVLGDDGQILSPAGAPNAVLFLARQPGRAMIDVVTGDPWHASKSTTLEITVEP
jgi:hypothetical protein